MSKTGKAKPIESIADLTPDPRNARKHNPRNIKLIQDSLHDVGAARSIVIDENGVILAGNGVTEAANLAGIEKVQVIDADGETLIAVRRSGLTAKQKKKLALADNRATELSEWDTDVLAEIAAQEGDLLDGLFDENELAELIGQGEAQEETADVGELIDKAAELQKKWKCARGEIFEIPSLTARGKAHRLMCGDSTNAEDVAKLMGGERAQFTFTDPPYNVGVAYGDATNDNRSKVDFISWCRLWAAHLPKIVLMTVGIKRLLWWDEILGDPQWVIAWVKRNGQGNTKLGGTNKWDAILCYGVTPDNDTDLIELNNDYSESIKSDGGHPTAKPVALWAKLIERFSKRGAIVFEPFTGTGTSLLACEQTGRIGRGMEIEPKYVAVCLERLSLLGLTPKRLENE